MTRNVLFYNKLIILTTLSLISLYLLYISSSNTSFLLCIIPLVYGIMLTLTFNSEQIIDSKRPGVSTVNVFYFVKCVVYPFLEVITNNTYAFDQSLVNTVLLIEIGEILTVYSVIGLFDRYHDKDLQNKIQNGSSNKYERIFISGFVILSLAIIATNPSVLLKYNLFTVSSIDVINQRVLGAESNAFFGVVISWAKIVFTILILRFAYLKYRNSCQIRYILLSAIVILANIAIVDNVSRSSFVIPGICGLFIIIRLFGRKGRIATILLGIVLVFVFITFSQMRFNGGILGNSTGTLDGLRNSLQAYFCGIKNLAVALQTRMQYASEISFATLLNDLLGNWMVIGKLFRGTLDINQMFNITYYGRDLSYDQIVPTVGQSIIQFGYLGTYIYTIIMTFIIVKFDSLYRQETELEFSYLYLLCSVKCGITLMGSFKIFMATFLNTFIPLYAIFMLNRYFVVKRK